MVSSTNNKKLYMFTLSIVCVLQIFDNTYLNSQFWDFRESRDKINKYTYYYLKDWDLQIYKLFHLLLLLSSFSVLIFVTSGSISNFIFDCWKYLNNYF